MTLLSIPISGEPPQDKGVANLRRIETGSSTITPHRFLPPFLKSELLIAQEILSLFFPV